MSDGCSAHGSVALAPSPWFVRFASLVPPGARVLDLACGTGRHARLFASRGCRVLAVDRDPAALATLGGVAGAETARLDLESGPWPLEGERFDAIIVANYLHRPLFGPLLRALAADGTLLYETFARGNEVFGRPSKPDFLLEAGELLRVAEGLTVVAYEHGSIETGARRAVVQRIAAVGYGRPAPAALPPA